MYQKNNFEPEKIS